MKAIVYVNQETLVDFAAGEISGFVASPTPDKVHCCQLIVPLDQYSINPCADFLKVFPRPRSIAWPRQ